MSTFELVQDFVIHPVGQGLFYSLKIKHRKNERFRMVFDCGSNNISAGKEEVELYRSDPDFIKDKLIDLLVISHFDADHVNRIGDLLSGGVRVKGLVMPFLTFEERLFLLLNYLESPNIEDESIDFTSRLILEPFLALSDNLDSDGLFYAVSHGPSSPDNSDFPNLDSNFDFDESRLSFEYTSNSHSEELSDYVVPKNLSPSTIGVLDSNKGILYSEQSKKPLMEFIFYRRSVGESEVEFYSKVKEIFYKEYGIDLELKNENRLNAILEKLKTFNSSKQVKEIFKKAKEELHIKFPDDFKYNDLNTTALCMLHRNNEKMLKNLACNDVYSSSKYYGLIYREALHIQKFLGSRIYNEVNLFSNCEMNELCCSYLDSNHLAQCLNSMPDTLLCSDSFLLTDIQTQEFLNHYSKYWKKFWLFQVPHHGSDKSSDDKLYNNIARGTSIFVNYGTGNRDGHPNYSVIKSIVTSGLSLKLISITEFRGFQFTYSITLIKSKD